MYRGKRGEGRKGREEGKGRKEGREGKKEEGHPKTWPSKFLDSPLVATRFKEH